MFAPLAFIVVAYLIGSISFAVVCSRLFRLPDPHSYGSGNPGATNVLRTGNKAAAVLTMLGDGAKGWLAVWLAQRGAESIAVPEWTVPAVALAGFIGHLYPVFHRFAGGKGVSPAAGIVLALYWPLGLVLIVVWLCVIFGSRMSSLAALTCAVLMQAGMFYAFGNSWTSWAMAPICALMFWRHRDNIGRLLAGNEHRVGE